MCCGEIDVQRITETVERIYHDINFNLREDVLAALNKALQIEESETGREIIRQILENASLSIKQKLPLCQDTGVAVVFVQIGQDVHLVGGDLAEAVNEGVRRARARGYLRASLVRHPLDRENTGDNTPAMLHVELVPGRKIAIDVVARGAGGENCGRVKMLSPSDGKDGVVDFVLDTVRQNGANACPPLVVGVGIGGTQDVAALITKKAFLRDINEPSPDPICAELEDRLLGRINALGVGPQGLGGRVTALAVLVEARPCHIASLPVCVNLMCHSFRHGHAELKT